jgi:hypothetical protein
VKIEDYQVHLGAAELTSHLLATGRRSGADVIVPEIVYDHALQGRIILDDEDAHLVFTVPVKARAV